jgi:prepilin-type N-terminal cleavage/methylation domain-containing protein
MISKFLLFKPLASRTGFSLIEVLVAIGILSVAILGLAVGAITITRANKTSQFHTVATNLAQDKLEKLRAGPFAGVVDCSTNCDGVLPPTYQGVTYLRSWTVAPNTATFKQINVTVQWTDYILHSLTVSSAMSPNT